MRDRIKQVIIFREDLLPQPTGKIAAQIAHCAMLFILRKIVPYKINEADYPGYDLLTAVEFSEEEKYWLTTSFTKVVLRCNNLAHLVELGEKALAAGLEVHSLCDTGFVAGERVITCLAISPAFSSKVDNITGGLKLL